MFTEPLGGLAFLKTSLVKGFVRLHIVTSASDALRSDRVTSLLQSLHDSCIETVSQITAAVYIFTRGQLLI